jgi:hypothetical protein
MKTSSAIQLAGGVSALAEILNITHSAVSQWGDDIPRLREYELRDKRPEWFVRQAGRPKVGAGGTAKAA